MRDRLPTRYYGVDYSPLTTAQIIAGGFDTFIMEGDATTAAQVAELNAAGITTLAYISLSETDENRDYWNPAWTSNGLNTGDLTAAAPGWLGPRMPYWDSRMVAYWDADWFTTALAPHIAELKAMGFDGVFMDNVQGFYNWTDDGTWWPADQGAFAESGIGDTSAAMVGLIHNVSEAWGQDGYVVMNGGADLMQMLYWNRPADYAQLQQMLLGDVSGIMQESAFYQPGGTLDPYEYVITSLTDGYADNGVPVLILDYIHDMGPAVLNEYIQNVVQAGFIPYAANSDEALNELTPALNRPTSGADTLFGGPNIAMTKMLGGNDSFIGHSGKDIALGGGGTDTLNGHSGIDTLKGQGGDDVVLGGNGNDTLLGNNGNDLLWGEDGKDKLNGGNHDDVLFGGAHNDRLIGGNGRDVFLFTEGDGSDEILDFALAEDLLRFDGFAADPASIAFAGDATRTLVTFGDVEILLQGVDLADAALITAEFV